MENTPLVRAVIDTNVVFEGLTKQQTASGWIIDAWLAGLFCACVSNAIAYEYVDVLSRKLSSDRWKRVRKVLGTLLENAYFVKIYFTWRPSSSDPGDEHIIDCAMNAGAIVVTSNVRDFRIAQETLGLKVVTPVQFIQKLIG